MSCTAAVPKPVVDALGGHEPTCQQWEAISHPLEPCALIAGAGSGKTAVMAARIVWIVEHTDVRPGEILGLTFTNKAAENLSERVRRAMAALDREEGDEPAVMTYHAFAARLIQDHGLRGGIEPAAALLTEAQAWQLCADIFASRTYEKLEVRSLYHVSAVRQLADDCANHLVDPGDIVAHDREFIRKIAETAVKISAKPREAAEKRIELTGVVAAYVEAKRARNVLDYGDQIRFAHELAQDPVVAAEFRAQYRVALLDEYQDTNVAQARMLRELMPDGYPVMAVGDPDQNIYAWRGASLHNLLAFSEQFPAAGGDPAAVRPLEVNFRSDPLILDLANDLISRIPARRRPPDKELRPAPGRAGGAVAVFLATDQVSEAERIAAEAAATHAAGTRWAEIAVLCRKKRLIAPVVEALRRRDVPVEVIGLGGLLKMPEVIDLMSLLRVLDDPMRNTELARLLRGPRWRIGHRDLALIARHMAARNRDLHERLAPDESPGDVAFSLAEALDEIGEIEALSPEARERIADFCARLAELRRRSYLPPPELAQAALDLLGLPQELDASASPAAASMKRNLSNFCDRIAAFAPVDGEATLGALIEWLDAVDEAAEEMEASQPSEEDSVKVMTIHQAKGLEFDVVFVPGLAAGGRSKIFPDTTGQANPIEQAGHLPFELRGDKAVLPSFDGTLSHFKDDLRDRAMEEERRLLYVAVTRARHRVVCSAAHWYFASGLREDLKTPMGPSEFWTEIRGFAGVEVIEEVPGPAQNPLIEQRRARAEIWPQPARRDPDPGFPEGLAEAVRAARAQTPPGDERLFDLPPEAPAAPAPPQALPATALVTHARCPLRFYWTHVRPLPKRRSAAAQVGTLVHAWIEERATRPPRLIEMDDLDEEVAAEVDPGRVAALKGAFAASRFGRAKHALTEQPFSLVVQGVRGAQGANAVAPRSEWDFVVRGKIDAVLELPEGRWEIVDWKTGRPPEEDDGPEWIQLDAYALAVQEVWGKRPEDLVLTFAYVGGEPGAETVIERSRDARPAEEIRAGLAARLAEIAGGEFEASPGDWCRHCDFLRFCEPGRAFLT